METNSTLLGARDMKQTQPLTSGSSQPHVRDKHINYIKYEGSVSDAVTDSTEGCEVQSSFPKHSLTPRPRSVNT